MVEHAPVTEIDQERSIAVAQDIDVAGVGPDKEMRMRPCVRLGKSRSGKLAGTGKNQPQTNAHENTSEQRRPHDLQPHFKLSPTHEKVTFCAVTRKRHVMLEYGDERKKTHSHERGTDPLDQTSRSPEKLRPRFRRAAAWCRPTRCAIHHTTEEPRAGGYHSPDRTSWRQDNDGHHGFDWHRAGRKRETCKGNPESLWRRGYGQGGTDRNSRRPARGRRPYPDQRRFSAGV